MQYKSLGCLIFEGKYRGRLIQMKISYCQSKLK